MADAEPDFFLCSGDFVYADGPIVETVALPDGTTWKNTLTDEKSKVAETLEEYRGQFKYNLLDENLRAFLANVPMVNQWDDHEVTNNWYPGEILDLPQYTEKNVDVLAARARQAFAEYHARTASAGRRGGPDLPQDRVRPAAGRVRARHADLQETPTRTPTTPRPAARSSARPSSRGSSASSRRSNATWKVIAADLPIGLVVRRRHRAATRRSRRATRAAPLAAARCEIADLLSYAKRESVKNLVWLTADVHYTAAHHYSPDRAAFQDFDPFWEFVSGPLNAGAFGPNKLDATFGPEAVFVKAPPAANTSPAQGYQFFGQVDIDAETGCSRCRSRTSTAPCCSRKALEPVA